MSGTKFLRGRKSVFQGKSILAKRACPLGQRIDDGVFPRCPNSLDIGINYTLNENEKFEKARRADIWGRETVPGCILHAVCYESSPR